MDDLRLITENMEIYFMSRKFGYALAILLASSTAALAGDCFDNYRSGGSALTGLNYSSWAVFPNVSPKVALEKARRAIIAEGLMETSFDPSRGEMTAMQDSGNSGRPQTASVTVRKVGKGSRVAATFQVQPGQAPVKGMVGYICRWVNSAGK